MKQQFSSKINFKPIGRFVYFYLPLLAAILLDAHLKFMAVGFGSGLDYLMINLRLIIECIPYFVVLYAIKKVSFLKSLWFWIVGFILYPCFLILLNSLWNHFSAWQLMDLQTWLLCSLASLFWISYQHFINQGSDRFLWLHPLFSLNGMVLFLLIGWALLMAGVFNTVSEPMLNQPLNIKVDLKRIFTDFFQYSAYFLQFLFIAFLMWGLYFFNRYVLIRHVLATHGIMPFVLSSFICLMIYTPLSVWLLLLLPLNDIPKDVNHLTPSGSTDIFSLYNYQFTLFFLAITTPIILAFERQQQSSKITKIKQQQLTAELKLLQQQINPHFLFNTLNNLYALTLTKSDDAPKLIEQLADLLRYSVYEGAQPQVKLSKEVEYLQNFIALQAIRSGEKCRFITEWPETTENYNITPLLLVVLLENAIKHGVEPATEKVEIVFKLQLKESQLHIVCCNPIHKQSNENHGGVGLTNLQRRLTLLYPDRHTLIHSCDNAVWQSNLTLELDRC